MIYFVDQDEIGSAKFEAVEISEKGNILMGAGWRMHYWRKIDPAGKVSIEFSNVLTKHDPVILY